MIWIAIYLLMGLAVLALYLILNLPYDVCVGDVLAAPFLIAGWPGVVVYWAVDSGLSECHLFTIGGHRDNQD